MQPDYSADALRLFLYARVRHAGNVAARFEPSNRASGERAEKRRIRKAAGVTNVEFDMAWMGRVRQSATRTRLWAALDVYPADFGVVLTDDGGQMMVPQPSSPPVGKDSQEPSDGVGEGYFP